MAALSHGQDREGLMKTSRRIRRKIVRGAPGGRSRLLDLFAGGDGVSLGEEGLQFVNQVGAIDLAFPDDKYRPTHFTKFGTGGGIALLVSEQLRSPILKPRARQSSSAAARMQVPETSVNENDFRLFGKHNIRASGKIGSMEPVAEPATMKKTSNLALRLRILALDAPHVLASAIWWYVIHLLSRYRFSKFRTTSQRPLDGIRCWA